MKKTICILAALAMMATCACFGAFASEADRTYDMPVAGMKFTAPQAYEDAKGLISTDGVMELGEGSNVFYTYFYYGAVDAEEMIRMANEDPDGLQGRLCVLFYAFAVGGNRDFSAVTEATGGSVTQEDVIRIGESETYTFWLYMIQEPGFAESIGAEYRDDYENLCSRGDEVAAGFTCYEPVNEYTGITGTVLRFTGADLDGNPVASEDVFAKHEVTMVNIWATWCGPCVGELAELQAIHNRILGEDYAVVGLMADDDTAKARRLLEENGVTYDIVVAPANISSMLPIVGYPTTIFVDREGKIIGTMVVGAYPDQYEAALASIRERKGKVQ